MPWVRFDDEYDDHPKIEAGGPLVQLLHVKATVWCARVLSDGRLPRSRAELLAYSILSRVGGGGDGLEATALVDAAIDVRLLDVVDGGLAVHDYLDYQPSKKKVEAERVKARKRQRSHRERKASQ